MDYNHVVTTSIVVSSYASVVAFLVQSFMSFAVGAEVTFGTLLSVAAHAINVLPWTSPRRGS